MALFLQTGSDLQAYVTSRDKECRQRGVTRQPQVLVLGASMLAEDCAYYCIIDDTIYQLDGLLKAVDVCFKTFFVYNIEYPVPCRSVWTFIQRAIYGIQTPFDALSPRVIDIMACAAKED